MQHDSHSLFKTDNIDTLPLSNSPLPTQIQWVSYSEFPDRMRYDLIKRLSLNPIHKNYKNSGAHE